jgi:PIN domain nuclease of toxin-antitoxin system
VIYLDTHVLLWLYEGVVNTFPAKAKCYLEENQLYISPIVELELQYLFEIQRIKQTSQVIVTDLAHTIGLKICAEPLQKIVHSAMQLQWTRDPFDRLIVASAKNKQAMLLTKDKLIHGHYNQAVWDK